MSYSLNLSNNFGYTSSFRSFGNLYLQEPRYEPGVVFTNSSSPERFNSSISMTRPSANPSIPLIMPNTAPKESFLFNASLTTPYKLALITAVGPPDCPTITFFFISSSLF